MRRNTVTFDDHTYLLAPTTSPADLQRAVVARVTSGVGFVDVGVAGARTMCVLVSDRTSVVFESEEFDEPERRRGPVERIYLEEFDPSWG